MTSSFDDIKNDKSAAFFNYPNSEFPIKSFKNHGQYYCVSAFSYANNTHLNIQTHDLLPKNTYSNSPFVNGSDKVDFELDQKNNLLYHKFFLTFDLKNENDTNNLQLINSNLFIERISILKNGNEISTVEPYYLYLKNMEGYNLFNTTYYSDNYNVSELDFNNNNNIAPNTTKTFFIDLHNSLRKSNILSTLLNNITIRIKWKKDIVNGGTVTNSDIILSNLKMIIHYIEIPNYSVSSILSHPQFNVYINKPYYYNRILNNLTANTETYIELDIKFHISKLKIFITDSNPSNANLLNFYGIKEYYINDNANLNILNGKKITEQEHNLNLHETYSQNNKFYFYRKKGNIYIVNFSAHQDVSDANSYVSSQNFKRGIHRLYFTPKTTVNTSVTVHILAYIPSLITVTKNDYIEQYS